MLIVVLLGAALSACEKEDSAAIALAAAERSLSAIHPGGATSAPASQRESVYAQTISTLQAPMRDGTEAQRDAAGLLLARSHAGLSRIHADRAETIERNLLDLSTQMMAQLDRSIMESSLGSAMAGVDFSNERVEYDQALGDVEVRTSEAQAARRSLQSEIDRLKSLVAEKTEVVNQSRAALSSIRSSVLDATASEAAELVRQGYQIQRVIASVEIEASNLSAELEKLQPRLDEQDRLLRGLSDERAQLTEARARVSMREQDARQQAQTSQANALAAAEEVAKYLNTIESLRAGELAEHWRLAIEAAEKAAQSAGQARGVDRATSSLIRGETQQRIAEMHSAVARGLERYQLLLDATLGAPAASSLTAQAREIRTRIESEYAEASRAAADAAAEAAGSYQGASVRDPEVRERLDRVQEMLQPTAPPEQVGEAPAFDGASDDAVSQDDQAR